MDVIGRRALAISWVVVALAFSGACARGAGDSNTKAGCGHLESACCTANGELPCVSGLTCVRDACRIPLNGQMCASDSQCASNVCDEVHQRCCLPEGEHAIQDRHCCSGTTNDDSRCTGPRTAPEGCGRFDELCCDIDVHHSACPGDGADYDGTLTCGSTGFCVRCGDAGQACCEDDTCVVGECTFGTCVGETPNTESCVEVGDPCCVMGVDPYCQNGLVCAFGRCDEAMVPEPEPCAPDLDCSTCVSSEGCGFCEATMTCLEQEAGRTLCDAALVSSEDACPSVGGAE